MSEKEVKDIELTQEEMEDEVFDSSEEILNQLAVSEEIKRIEIQDDPTSKATKEIRENQLFKELIAKAHIVGESLQILLGYGLDYNNALAISSNLVTGAIEIEKIKAQDMSVRQVQY